MLKGITGILVSLIVASILALSCLVRPISVFAVEGPTLPWKTFSESVPDVVKAGTGECDQGEFVAAYLLRDGKLYLYFYAPDSNVLVMGYFSTQHDQQPITVGRGIVDPAKHDEIPSLVWEPYDSIKHDVCTLLFPKSANIPEPLKTNSAEAEPQVQQHTILTWTELR